MIKSQISTLFFLLFVLGCQTNPKVDSVNYPVSIIPQVQQLENKVGSFQLDAETRIILPADSEAWQWVANDLIRVLNPATGFEFGISEEKGNSNITFEQSESFDRAGAYQLSVDPYEIIIRSKDAQGAFYGVQTLLQLLPATIFAQQKKTIEPWRIPCVTIEDAPRFSYRGMHLDVGRHFFDVQSVKKYIDLLAMHKMNYFHWHLTEDQGWRIEIKKYPKLTSISAYRAGTLIGHYNDQPHQFDNKTYGGFYTQEEIKEVVQYAKERFITIIPEIELPGHSQAALAAYPELACSPGPYEALQKWGVSDQIYCPTETTFEFLENVLTEVIDLFPSKYIHIGGDECPKRSWEESTFCQQLMKKEKLKDEAELQSYFIRRIERFVNSKGRSIIGWDEILEGGLAPNATVMSWQGIEGGIEAARSGHDVVMSPTSHCYFDYYQSDHPMEPLAIGGFIPLEKVYEYEPIPEELTAEEAKHILGVQGNVWSEYMPTFKQVEYMAFPRACALAEVAWSTKARRDFPNFVDRLTHHIKRLEAKRVNTANHLYDLKSSIQPKDGVVQVRLETLAEKVEIRYTLDGQTPDLESTIYQSPIAISESAEIKAQAFLDGKEVGRAWTQNIDMHLAAAATIQLLNQPHGKYSGDGNGSLVNGVKGSEERYGDKEWLGFDGENFETVIDLGEEKLLKQIKLRFFRGEGQWIYLPKSIDISVSEDGQEFKVLQHLEENLSKSEIIAKVNDFIIDMGSKKRRYLKIKAENYGIIPNGKQGAGHKAWLFVDEIIME